MARLTRLTVLAPGLRRALTQFEPGTRFPSLERLLARADRRARSPSASACSALETWQLDLLHALHLPEVPSAPCSALGAGLEPRPGTWLHADFVHVAAGLDQLVLVPLYDAQTLSDDARMQLVAALAEHVREDGFECFVARDQLLLHTAAELRVDTCALGPASRLPLLDAMPQGEDAPQLRRLMTELQMRLHDHPVNRERERAGLLPANAVWLWGAGTQRAIPAPVTLTQVFGEHNFLRGLCRAANLSCAALPADGAALLEQTAASSVVLLNFATLQQLDARWLTPFERALNTGRLRELELTLDDIHLIARSIHRWRLWRRIQPLSSERL
jgi:hypothetical protein